MDFTVFYLLMIATACGLIGSAVAGARGGNPTTGFVVGLLLGPFGVVLAFLLGGETGGD